MHVCRLWTRHCITCCCTDSSVLFFHSPKFNSPNPKSPRVRVRIRLGLRSGVGVGVGFRWLEIRRIEIRQKGIQQNEKEPTNELTLYTQCLFAQISPEKCYVLAVLSDQSSCRCDETYLCICAARWRECVYVLQSVFFVDVVFRPPQNMRQPFSGTAERIFMKLLPNDRGENVVFNVVPKWGLGSPNNLFGAKNWKIAKNRDWCIAGWVLLATSCQPGLPTSKAACR